ncbi:MAG TPA: inositol monophosphatase family protein [Myxococcota bacterium]|nr:inositol monophosphatase family protein [Myxococcota bacterium]
MKEFVELAQRMADVGAALVREGYEVLGEVEGKSDGSPVTAIDREVEMRLREMVAERFPRHGFIGEEFPPENPDAECVWIVDPIDGTRSFIAGLPTFAVLIALRRAGRMVLGVIDQPVLRERWVGLDGHGTTRNGQPCRVAECASLDVAVLQTSGPLAHSRAVFPRMVPVHRAAGALIYEGEAVGFGLLARGRVDLIVDGCLKLHDIAGPLVVMREAGAIVTDWRGRPLGREHDGSLLAAGDPRVHAEALELLNA